MEKGKEVNGMPQSTKFYGWYMVAALWVIYFLNVGFPMYGGSVVNTLMAKDLNLSRSILGLGFTLFTLTQGLPGPLIGMTINKKGVRFALVLGSALIVISGLLMATVVTSGWAYILVFGVIAGIGVGFGSVMPVQTGVTLWFNRKRALAMSIALTAAGIGGFVAAPVLTRVINLSGGHWPFGWYFVAGTAALALLVAAAFVRNRPEDLGQVPDGNDEGPQGLAQKVVAVYKTVEEWTPAEALRNSKTWLIFIGAVGFYVPYMMCVAHGVIHLTDKGFDTSVAAMSIGTLTLCSIVGRLLGGFLGDRVEPRFIWSGSLLVLLIGLIAVMNASTATHMMVYAICVGIGFGAAFVCMPTVLANYYGPKAFASIMGTIFPILTIFASASPFFAGAVFDATGTYSTAFITGAVFACAGAVALSIAKPPVKPL